MERSRNSDSERESLSAYVTLLLGVCSCNPMKTRGDETERQCKHFLTLCVTLIRSYRDLICDFLKEIGYVSCYFIYRAEMLNSFNMFQQYLFKTIDYIAI